MKGIITIIASLLAIAMSPVVLKHACGLTSWPLDWAVCIISITIVCVAVQRSKKRWRQWMAAIVAAPVISFCGTLLLGEVLHSDRCPLWLYDSEGKAWIRMTHERQMRPGHGQVPTPVR